MSSGTNHNPEVIGQAIRDARTIVVCSHINPDGDTLGCATAIRLALLRMGKQVTLVCDGKIPDQLAFLPGADTFLRPEQASGFFDLMLAVDVSDEGRLGGCRDLMDRCRHTAQIDHHPTNPLYMQANYVDGKSPAACILIRRQLRELGIPLDRDIAICLYTGISTDTGNFSFNATNAETFEVMAELMRCDLPLSELSRVLFRERSRQQLALMGRAISKLRYEGDGRIAVIPLTKRDFQECGALSEHADTIVNLGLETTGTEMALLARETGDGQIKFSLRAKSPGRIDDVATMLGGGGHPQASGITLTGTLETLTDQVVRAMIQKLKNERTTE